MEFHDSIISVSYTHLDVYKRQILFTLPMLIPSISHGMGLVVLFGSNGVITNLLHRERIHDGTDHNAPKAIYVSFQMKQIRYDACLLYTSRCV